MHEGVDILELAVHGGKADIGHLVGLFQLFHHLFADDLGADLPLQRVLDLLLDLAGHTLHIRHGHGTLFAGALDALHDLAAVKALAAAILLDDHHGQAFYRFIGGKALLALQALTAAADAAAFVSGAGIHDLALFITTIGTSHLSVHTLPPLQCGYI